MSESKYILDSSVDIKRYRESENVEVQKNMVLLCEQGKQYIKYLLSNSSFQEAERKVLGRKKSTCCSVWRAEDRGQLQDPGGMSLCRKTSHECWSPHEDSKRTQPFSSCLCTCSLAGRNRRMSLNPEGKKNTNRKAEFLG